MYSPDTEIATVDYFIDSINVKDIAEEVSNKLQWELDR